MGKHQIIQNLFLFSKLRKIPNLANALIFSHILEIIETLSVEDVEIY